MRRTILAAFLFAAIATSAFGWSTTGTQLNSSGWSYWNYSPAVTSSSTTEYPYSGASPSVQVLIPQNMCTTTNCSGDPGGWFYDHSATKVIWIQYYFKYKSDYHFHPSGNKQIYFKNASNQAVMIIDGPLSDGGTMRPIVGAAFGSYGGWLTPNITATPIYRNTWYKIKFYWNLNTGLVEYWVNDVKNASYTGITSSEIADTSITSTQVLPIWGGQGITGPSVNNYVWFDSVYISNDTAPDGGVSPSDQTAPYTSGHSPSRNATGVAVTAQTISAHVLDTGDGVTQSSIQMDISTGQAETRTRSSVLSYIQGLSSQALSGQFTQFIPWPTYGLTDFNATASVSGGLYPALMGADFGSLGFEVEAQDITDMIGMLTSHWNSGGLVTVSWHMKNPENDEWTWDDYSTCPEESCPPVTLSELYTPGNQRYTNFHAELDTVAARLQQLEDAGVVVLFRPMHEMNGGWFWWGLKNAAQYKNLWIHIHDYLTNTKGLSNLIWVYAVNVNLGNTTTYYPGSGYVDITGIDYYSATARFSKPGEYDPLVALGKPVFLTEVGQCAPGLEYGCSSTNAKYIIDDIKSNMPAIKGFMVWGDPYSLASRSNVTGLFGDSWVIDRSEVTGYSGTATYACSDPELSCTGTSADYTVTYDRGENWADNQTVTVAIRATDAAGNVMPQDQYSITYAASASAPDISFTEIDNGTVGAAYSASLSATGGTTPYTWSVVGTAPPGLSVYGNNLQGTPTTAGTYSFTLKVVDAGSQQDNVSVSVTIAPLLPGGQITVTTRDFYATYINSGSGDTGYADNDYLITYQWPSGTVANRILLVDNTTIVGLKSQNISITSMKLRMYNHVGQMDGAGGTDPMRVYVRQIIDNTPSIPDATWNNYASTTGENIAMALVGKTSGWVEWDLTTIGSPVYSADGILALEIDGGQDGAVDTNRAFYSDTSDTYEPMLIIVYTQLTAPPPSPSIPAPGNLRVSSCRCKFGK